MFQTEGSSSEVPLSMALSCDLGQEASPFPASVSLSVKWVSLHSPPHGTPHRAWYTVSPGQEWVGIPIYDFLSPAAESTGSQEKSREMVPPLSWTCPPWPPPPPHALGAWMERERQAS
jgi:hypothetical protein